MKYISHFTNFSRHYNKITGSIIAEKYLVHHQNDVQFMTVGTKLNSFSDYVYTLKHFADKIYMYIQTIGVNLKSIGQIIYLHRVAVIDISGGRALFQFQTCKCMVGCHITFSS